MPVIHPSGAGSRLHYKHTPRICTMIRLSLGLPLLVMTMGAQAQVSGPAGISGVNISAMDLETALTMVLQQRASLLSPDLLNVKLQKQQTVQQEQKLLTAKSEGSTSGGEATTQTASPGTKSEMRSRPQLMAMLGGTVGKSGGKPATTQDVTMYLASGQGNNIAQAQAVAPSSNTIPVSTAAATNNGATNSETAAPAPTPTTSTAGGIGGISTGGMAQGTWAVITAATAASSSDSNTSLGSLQQQQDQGAATAAQQQAYAYVAANMVTPLASFPTSLRATYTGPVNGTLNSGAGVSGTFQANVDFATIRGFAPSVPGSITFSNGQGGTTFTLTLLGGYVGGAMSGTYAGQAVTGFVMNGQFFGPAAEQLAGNWSMQNGGGSLSASGTFKAQR